MHHNFCFLARISEAVDVRNIGPDHEYDQYEWVVPDDLGWLGLCSMQIIEPMPRNIHDILHYIAFVFAHGVHKRDRFGLLAPQY